MWHRDVHYFFLISAMALCAIAMMQISPAINTEKNANSAAENVSMNNEVQRLTRETQDRRDTADFWDTWNLRALALAGFAAICLVITAIGVSRSNRKYNASSDALGRAKDQAFSLALAREETARIEIEERYAARRIFVADRTDQVSRLKVFAPTSATLWFGNGDKEAGVFASDIGSMLDAAKWEVFAPASDLIFAEFPRKGITVIETGVTVCSPDSLDAARAVVRELNTLGFDARLVPCAPNTPESSHNMSHFVKITVETRPEGAQGAAKLKRPNP